MRCWIALGTGFASILLACPAGAQATTPQDLLSRYVDQRFGMFIHYNMNTYHAGWAENRVDPKTFAPPNVDCHTFTDQWAAAAKSAGMKFGILTAKHHDGFAIWPTRAVPPASSPYGSTPYTIAQSSVPTMDVVRCYVDSFRAQGLDPDLYFSIWDPNNGIGSQAGHNTAPGPVDWNVVGNFVTSQITELLTNYGDIPLFVFDGYQWLTGHQQVPYQQIRALVRRLQPNAIVMDHNGGVPWEVDTVYFEEPLGITVPVGNLTPGSQGQTIAKNLDWFWDSAQATTGYLAATDIANELKRTEPNYTNFILDCPPNPQGLLDAPVVATLAQIPGAWSPNGSRAPLPAQLARIEVPFTAIAAMATSGNAALAVDGYNDGPAGVNNTLHGTGHGESLWTSVGPLPQSVTVDLGQIYDHIDILEYLPQRHTGTTAGNITAYKIFVSSDNSSFTSVASGSWPSDPTFHGLLVPERAQFSPQSARFVRLEADAVSGGGPNAIVGEIAVGSSTLLGGGDAGVPEPRDAGGDATEGGPDASAVLPTTDGGEVGSEAGGPAVDTGATSSPDASTDAADQGSSNAGPVRVAAGHSGGCGCDVASPSEPAGQLGAVGLVGLVAFRRSRVRRKR